MGYLVKVRQETFKGTEDSVPESVRGSFKADEKRGDSSRVCESDTVTQ